MPCQREPEAATPVWNDTDGKWPSNFNDNGRDKPAIRSRYRTNGFQDKSSFVSKPG